MSNTNETKLDDMIENLLSHKNIKDAYAKQEQQKAELKQKEDDAMSSVMALFNSL